MRPHRRCKKWDAYEHYVYSRLSKPIYHLFTLQWISNPYDTWGPWHTLLRTYDHSQSVGMAYWSAFSSLAASPNWSTQQSFCRKTSHCWSTSFVYTCRKYSKKHVWLMANSALKPTAKHEPVWNISVDLLCSLSWSTLKNIRWDQNGSMVNISQHQHKLALYAQILHNTHRLV